MSIFAASLAKTRPRPFARAVTTPRIVRTSCGDKPGAAEHDAEVADHRGSLFRRVEEAGGVEFGFELLVEADDLGLVGGVLETDEFLRRRGVLVRRHS